MYISANWIGSTQPTTTKDESTGNPSDVPGCQPCFHQQPVANVGFCSELGVVTAALLLPKRGVGREGKVFVACDEGLVWSYETLAGRCEDWVRLALSGCDPGCKPAVAQTGLT